MAAMLFWVMNILSIEHFEQPHDENNNLMWELCYFQVLYAWYLQRRRQLQIFP